MSDLLYASPNVGNADIRLSIAIPTFRRPDLLLEAIASVLMQTDLNGVELIVVEDDPLAVDMTSVLRSLPLLGDIAFRYYRNSANAGLFGNWNICLSLARGDWVSILNDDDLLASGFVAAVRAALVADPGVDAVVCSLRFFDQRLQRSDHVPDVPGKERVRNVFRFGLRGQRRLRAAHMFFGSLGGSGLGLVVRRSVIRSLGGYQAQEYPSADYFLMTRLAHLHRFIQLRDALAISRVDQNVSARPETQLGFLRCQARLQEALLAGDVVPSWWRRIRAATMGIALRHTNRYWQQQFSPADVAQMIDAPISYRHIRLIRWYRLLIGAV